MNTRFPILAGLILFAPTLALAQQPSASPIIPGGAARGPVSIVAPSLDYLDKERKLVYSGGVVAKQHIVCALMQGPEEHYALCDEIARIIYGPVIDSHRCTMENIAMLEPALSETVGITLAIAMKQATDEAVKRGVPEAAAREFMLGHINIGLSIAFGAFPEGRFSDGALYAISQAQKVIFKDNWLEAVFSEEAIKRSVQEICNPPK